LGRSSHGPKLHKNFSPRKTFADADEFLLTVSEWRVIHSNDNTLCSAFSRRTSCQRLWTGDPGSDASGARQSMSLGKSQPLRKANCELQIGKKQRKLLAVIINKN
jgi:hypothetical protein